MNSQIPPGRRGPSQWETAREQKQWCRGSSLGAGYSGRLENSEKWEWRALKGRQALPAAGRGPAVAIAEEHRGLACRQEAGMEETQ